MAHWDYTDDLMACKFYLKHKDKSIAKVALLVAALDHKFSVNSVKAKLKNYAYLATGTGLANCNWQSKYIYRLLTCKKSVSMLSSAAKGKQTADVANASIRNILTLVSQYVGYVTTQDVFDANRHFHYRCPYTGADLTEAVQNREKGIVDRRVELDHIVPQNDEYCGLNVKGNLIWVEASVNQRKSGMSYEEFIDTDEAIIADTTPEERADRIAAIRNYQEACGYDPESIRRSVSRMLQKKYIEIQKEQLDFAAQIVKAAKL